MLVKNATNLPTFFFVSFLFSSDVIATLLNCEIDAFSSSDGADLRDRS